MRNRILFVGADEATAQAVIESLQDEGTQVCRENIEQALPDLLMGAYNLLILDAGMNASEVWVSVNTIVDTVNIPIIALYEQNEQGATELLLAGATACVEKPVDKASLRAQITALFRTFPASVDSQMRRPLVFGCSLVLVPKYRRVYRNGKIMDLTKMEYELLYFLAQHPGQIFSNEEIYCHVWRNANNLWGDAAVKTCIKTLRKKLIGTEGLFIENVRGVGYRFVH